MRLTKGLPPNIHEIRQYLQTDPNAIYTYGDTIYSTVGQIPEDILEHEKVHQKQQGTNPEWWWKRYLIDPEFRKEEEVEAYATQLNWVKERTNSTIEKECLYDLAQNLKAPMYGLNLSHQKAETLIRRKAHELRN